jgi:hypothetical protein
MHADGEQYTIPSPETAADRFVVDVTAVEV